MENKNPDPGKMTEDQRRALEKWQQNKQIISNLSDIADMTQEMLSYIDSSSEHQTKTSKELGALLVDIRNTLSAIKDKKDPEEKDYSKPIVQALEKLQKDFDKSVKTIDIKPQVKVAVPQANIKVPDVKVDLKGVEKTLKTDVPKAFSEAIKSIPTPDKIDFQPLLDAWSGISEQLVSIETATRMKPQPGSMKISNSADSPIPITLPTLSANIDYDYLDVQQTDADTETYVFKSGGSGGSTIQTIIVNYTDSTKANIDNVAWS